MFEYDFVKIDLGGVFSANPKEDYRKIIEEKSKEGWRFVQIFAPSVTGNGVPKCFELIFEKEILM